MSRPTQSQAGAFFGILASVLVLVLTAMALVSMDGGYSRHRTARIEASDVTPTTFSLQTSDTGVTGR